MKNLTASEMIVQREDGTRFILKPSAGVPILRTIKGTVLGTFNGALIHSEDVCYVDFSDVVVDVADEGPFIVDRDIFDALPSSATKYITPDHGTSAIRNSFKQVYAVTRFAAKTAVPVTVFPFPTTAAL